MLQGQHWSGASLEALLELARERPRLKVVLRLPHCDTVQYYGVSFGEYDLSDGEFSEVEELRGQEEMRGGWVNGMVACSRRRGDSFAAPSTAMRSTTTHAQQSHAGLGLHAVVLPRMHRADVQN